MKNAFKIVLFSLLFVACGHKIDSADLPKLNGYWEIEKVVLPNGSEKTYTINETFDYFEIKSGTGFRKKVMPRLDGTFEASDISEKVSVDFKDGKSWLHYSTPFSKWKEELLSLSDTQMVLLNDQKKEYHYKKTGPINLMGDGKTTK